MNIIIMELISEALMRSEYDYFNAGSHNRKIFAGEMSVTPKFESLASGCVLHGIQLNNINEDLDSWLNNVEAEFRKVGALLCRFYFSHQSELHYKLLTDKGYEKVVEVGLVRSLDDSLKISNTTNGVLKPIHDDEGWLLKKNLYQKAKHGPDGHDMKDGAYADLEKLKCNAGYMTSYLYWKDNKPIGTVSLAIKDEFARLKNLLVDPDYRGQGIGSEIVLALMEEAKSLGSKTFGVYAVENMNSHKLYKNCGMIDILKQTEWTKELS